MQPHPEIDTRNVPCRPDISIWRNEFLADQPLKRMLSHLPATTLNRRGRTGHFRARSMQAVDAAGRVAR
eukprot:6731925-Prymnesium_polylepis.1